jgi:cell division protein FtsW (lipid II flippase)
MSRWSKEKEKAVERINPKQQFLFSQKNAIVFLIFFSELGCCCCCCSFLLLLLLLQQQFATAVAARITNTQHTGD